MSMSTINIDSRNYTIYLDNMIGSGVDGKVYLGQIDDSDITIVVKIMDTWAIMTENPKDISLDEKIKEFIQINKLAAQKNIGPYIYDIKRIVDRDSDNIYIFMEKFDGELQSLIDRDFKNNVSIKEIERKVCTVVRPIRNIMIENKIIIGDDNTNNYMYKIVGNKLIWARIDFTRSYFSDKYQKNNKFCIYDDTNKKYRKISL